MIKSSDTIKKFQIPALISVFILSTYFLLKFALPPFALLKMRQVIFEEIGLQLNIQKFYFEPFGLNLEFENLAVSNEHVIHKILFDVSIEHILKKRIVIPEIEIRGVDLKILKDENGYNLEYLKGEKYNKMITGGRNKDWEIVIKKLRINRSRVKFKDGPLLNIDKLTVLDLFSFDSSDETSFFGDLKLNDSKIELKGVVSNYLLSPTGEVSIFTDKIDFQSVNYFFPTNLNLIEGVFETKSKITFNDEGFRTQTNFKLNNFKLFSKDLKKVDYFIQDFELTNGTAEFVNGEVKIKADEAVFSNLILSITKEYLDSKITFSRNSKILLKEINFYKPNQTDKGITFFAKNNEGGTIGVSEYFEKNVKKTDVKILDVDLLPFSETFEAALGYQIESGKMNLNIDLETINQRTSGTAKLVLNQFKIDDENESGKDVVGETNLPLKTAISLIKNDQGGIELEFSISGDERNPEFGFLPLLRRGLVSLIVSELSTYVATKAATQFLPLLVSSIPFSPGNALLLVNGSYKFLTKPRFQDIGFFPNSDIINDKSKNVLPKLKKFLLKNKEFNFVLCPLASTSESEDGEGKHSQNNDEILKLAISRIDKVKQELLDTPEIVSQVIFCRPKIIKKKTTQGLIEISL